MLYLYKMQRFMPSPYGFSLLSLFTMITCRNLLPDISTVSTFDLILFWSDCHQKETTISIPLFNPQRRKKLIDAIFYLEQNVECKIIIKIC